MPSSITGLANLLLGRLVPEYNCRDTGSMDSYVIEFMNTNASQSYRQDHINTGCPVCGDGIINGNDICDDGDNNGTPEYCNATCTAILPPDADADGIADAYDNCPFEANPDQGNTQVSFAKANAANRALSGNQDRITDNVRLTR